MSTPSSSVYICSGVPLCNTYEHTLYFESAGVQEAYFLDHVTYAPETVTFLRPEHKIKLLYRDFNDAYSWNYLMLRNGTGKWLYHFINKVEYLNDFTVELTIELDVIQSFMFDWQLQECFIERTHTPTDVFGEHTIPEGLETGPLVRYSTHEISLNDCVIMMLMSCDAVGDSAWGKLYGGVYSGLATYAVPTNKITEFNGWLQTASDEGFIDAIVAMWMYPKELVITDDDMDNSDAFMFKVLDVGASDQKEVADPFHGKNTLNGVVIQNQKTLCYPNTMVYVSNNMGGSAIFRREWFTDEGTFIFKMYGALSPESGIKLAPQHYKSVTGDSINYEEGITLPPFPSCAWNSDVYKVWLAQNMVSQENAIRHANIDAAMSLATIAGGIAVGVATMNPTAIIGAGAGGIAGLKNSAQTVHSIMSQRQDMSVQPDQARGNHSASVNMSNGRMGFSIHFMCITPEYIQSIDDYFTRYGYRVNRSGVPQLHNRENYTYIKTAGALVTGAIGSDYLRKIQAIFDNGITFWAKPGYVGHYDLGNNLLE